MAVDSLILVGDVGGTNVRLGLAEPTSCGHVYTVHDFVKYNGQTHDTLNSMIADYLHTTRSTPKHASIALAGPVKDNYLRLTNRNWEISGSDIKDRFKFDNVRLYNDFAAMARSVPELTAKDFQTLHAGVPIDQAPIAVGGPGTGFGLAVLVPHPGGWTVIGGEGGHQAYAPQTPEETELLHIMQNYTNFVSLETVSSGISMNLVHRAVCERNGVSYERIAPADVRTRAEAGDPVCLEVCNVRAAAIMGAMGDIALTAGARGGVVLAGGVSGRLVGFLKKPVAMNRYFKRAHMSPYLKDIPIKLLHNPAAALYGAAAIYLDSVQ